MLHRKCAQAKGGQASGAWLWAALQRQALRMRRNNGRCPWNDGVQTTAPLGPVVGCAHGWRLKGRQDVVFHDIKHRGTAFEGRRGRKRRRAHLPVRLRLTCAPESLSLSEAPLPLPPALARPTRLPRDAEPSNPERRHGATGGYLAAPSGSGTRSRSASRGSATSRGVELQ